ncbi:MAG: hypothetical protein ACTHK4_08200, partial [Mycobacteriales bacterium]
MPDPSWGPAPDGWQLWVEDAPAGYGVVPGGYGLTPVAPPVAATPPPAAPLPAAPPAAPPPPAAPLPPATTVLPSGSASGAALPGGQAASIFPPALATTPTASVPSPPTTVPYSASVYSSGGSSRSGFRAFLENHKVGVSIAGVILLIALFAGTHNAGNSPSTKNTAGSTPAAATGTVTGGSAPQTHHAAAAAKPKPQSSLPANEQAFNAAVDRGKAAFDNQTNAIKARQAQARRNQGVCAAVPNLLAHNWVGTVLSIDTNGS